MRFAVHFLGLSLVLGSFACGSSSSTTSSVLRPELIAVSPADFLGSVRCLALSDEDFANPAVVGVRSYVATLFDVTPVGDAGVPDARLQLLSSPAVSCRQVITFSTPLVTDRHSYIVDVDAFQEAPNALAAVEPGGRDQLRDGVVTPAHWVATCGGYPTSPAASALEPSGSAGAGTPPATANEGGSAGTASAAPTAGSTTGVVAYDTWTRTPHNCGSGLAEVPAAN